MAGPDTSLPTSDPVAEARLLLEWVRGATGRFAFGCREAGPARRARGPAPPPAAPAPAPPEAAVPAPSGGPDPLDVLRTEALACRRCGLCETRTTVVFGEGRRRPRLMVVGEAPGADEDRTGRPFVGRAGQLLTRMLAAIGLSREDVYIGNVIKCRPPDNPPPRPDEVAACRPYVLEQIRLLEPELILVLGNQAAKAVLGAERGISSLRGRILQAPDGRPVLPTYHPAYLLRNPAAKREAWMDLQVVARTLGLSIPARPTPPGGDGEAPPDGGDAGTAESPEGPP